MVAIINIALRFSHGVLHKTGQIWQQIQAVALFGATNLYPTSQGNPAGAITLTPNLSDRDVVLFHPETQ